MIYVGEQVNPTKPQTTKTHEGYEKGDLENPNSPRFNHLCRFRERREMGAEKKEEPACALVGGGGEHTAWRNQQEQRPTAETKGEITGNICQGWGSRGLRPRSLHEVIAPKKNATWEPNCSRGTKRA